MSGLLYREDMDDVRERLTTWWQGGDIGRPAIQITAPRAEPLEDIEALPEPEGWVTHYSTTDLAYRVNLSARACVSTHYLGDAVPAVAPDLGPNCLALFLGCRGVESPGTVWFEPFIKEPERAAFELDPENFYWKFCLELAHEQLRLGRGKFLVQFPDLIEGLDTLAAMRGTQPLLVDLLERPEWVQACLGQITECYFDCYDDLYALFKDEAGGSNYWAWSPGRMAKLQCDFSAMISPGMFGDFMKPVLQAMCRRLDHVMYHWDGPGAIPHHDHLLDIDELDMIQWTPGAGAEDTDHERWWPLYHKSFERGKKLLIGCPSIERLRILKAEFGESWKQFLIRMGADTPHQADEILKIASD